MKKALTVLTVLVVVAVGLAFYMEWLVLSGPSSATESNKVNVNLTVDPDKAKEDAETVKKKATDLTGKVTDEVQDLGDEINDDVKSK